MTEADARIIVDLIEAATEGNWYHVRDAMLDTYGWKPREILSAVRKLCDRAGRSPILASGDF